jgi:hypothetical protein
MAIATRSYPTDLASPITATSLRDWLRDSLIAAGFPPALKTYTVGTDQFVVWQMDFDPTKTYGRPFYRIRVTAGLIVTHAVGATWTDATNTLGNPSQDTHSITYASNASISGWGFASDEFRLLSTSQGSLQQLLGYFRFADAPAFNEASFPKIFIPANADATSVTSTALTPYSSLVLPTSLGLANLASPDTYLQQRTQISGVFLYGPANTGVAARSSDDLAMGACTGMARGDVFQVPGSSPLEQFVLLKPGAGAMLIRI